MDVWWLRPLIRTVIVILENNYWCLLLDTENVDVSLILPISAGLMMANVIRFTQEVHVQMVKTITIVNEKPTS